MNNERLFNLVLMGFSSDKLTIEDEIERAVISNEPIEAKTTKIKNLIKRLVEIDNSIEKFNAMITNNDNKEQKQKN